MKVRAKINNGIIFEVVNKKICLYLLEFNKGPDMSPKNEIDRQIKTKVQEDMFDLVNLIKSSNNEFIQIV